MQWECQWDPDKTEETLNPVKIYVEIHQMVCYLSEPLHDHPISTRFSEN